MGTFETLSLWSFIMAKKDKQEDTETVEAPEAKTPAPKQPSQNGVSRPKSGTATGRVWEIADELSKAAGGPAARADVLKAFEAEGGNPATGATQYGRWKKFHGLAGTRTVKKAPEDEAEVEE